MKVYSCCCICFVESTVDGIQTVSNHLLDDLVNSTADIVLEERVEGEREGEEEEGEEEGDT